MKINKYIGNKQFYYKVLVIAIPLLIQQLITSFVNMLDNIMVGQTGTLAMSGVSVSNQIVTVFNRYLDPFLLLVSLVHSLLERKIQMVLEIVCVLN